MKNVQGFFEERGLLSPESRINELLRVKTVLNAVANENVAKEDEDALFLAMKELTEKEFGFFPADRSDFRELFETLKRVDALEFAADVFAEDRKSLLGSQLLTRYIVERIESLKPKSVLIAEAEKHLAGLGEMRRKCEGIELTLTTENVAVYRLLSLEFAETPDVTVRQESIYKDSPGASKYEYIHAFPAIGRRREAGEETGKTFTAKELDEIAVENLLRRLAPGGTMDAVVPAKMTFGGGGYKKLRSLLAESFGVESLFNLPEKLFRPVIALRLCLLSVSGRKRDTVLIGTYEEDGDSLAVTLKMEMPSREFLSRGDWRVELLLSEEDEAVRRFRESLVRKVRIREVAEVFRGKSILKKNSAPGKIGVLNISDLEGGEIDWGKIATIDEDERKAGRYILREGDVLLSCRGTTVKSAVFRKQERPVIPSANLLVIRPDASVSGDFLKIFFESPSGEAMIRSFQRGTSQMNLNHSDIMEMEMPLPPMERQLEIVGRYFSERKKYEEATRRWKVEKERAYRELLEQVQDASAERDD